MKRLLLALLLASLTAHSLPVKFQSKVYICVSPSAEVYHQSKECRGLRNCTHEIRRVTEDDAKNKYSRRKCKVCY